MLYIARNSIDNALAWEARLIAAIQSLKTTSGYAVDEVASQNLGRSVRRLVFEGNYLIHYIVSPDTSELRVISVRHVAKLPRPGLP